MHRSSLAAAPPLRPPAPCGQPFSARGAHRTPPPRVPQAQGERATRLSAQTPTSPWQPAPLSFKGRRKGRSRSIQAHGTLGQRPPALSTSGPIPESRQPVLQTSASAQGLAPRRAGSLRSLRTSAPSLHTQPPPVTSTGHLSVRERAEALVRSSLGSSTSSTLSFLFGKRGFSSALVISGLSAAEAGSTSDSQSSSSVNIVMGPSAQAASRATRVSSSTGWPGQVCTPGLTPPPSACRPPAPPHGD